MNEGRRKFVTDYTYNYEILYCNANIFTEGYYLLVMEEVFGPLLHGVRHVEVSHMYVRTVPEVVCSSTKRNLFVTAAVLSVTGDTKVTYNI